MISSLVALWACSPAPKPDVWLITLDTTRADALGAYGRAPSPTPALDALAASGVRAEDAMTVAPLTLPAHATMLTGLAPDRHGVRTNLAEPLSDALVTVPERLTEAGYRTGAVVGAVVLDASFGTAQGFSSYVDDFDPAAGPGRELLERRAPDVRAAAERFLDSADERPMFLWTHFFDAHQPHEAPEPFRSEQPDSYLAEVAAVDAEVGALVDAWRALGRGRALAILVVGDHGEGRSEHGELEHGLFVYRSTLRVPLLAVGPGMPAGGVDARLRSVLDVAPTLLAWAGLPCEGCEGTGLAEAPPADRIVYGESLHPRFQYGLSELRVAADERWRYVRAPRPELYDVRADPNERADVIDGNPDVAARFAAALDARGSPVTSGTNGDDQLRQALGALGYVEGATAIAASVPYDQLPDPKDGLPLVAALDDVTVAARSRPPAEAVPLLEGFVAEHPNVGPAWHLLSRARELSGDPAGALAALEPLVTARPDDPGLAIRQADLLLTVDRVSDAEALLDRVIARDPSAAAWVLWAEAARRRGDCPTAEARAERAMIAAPDSPPARTVRGLCRLARGDGQAAIEDLEAAARPGVPAIERALAEAYVLGGRPADALPLLQASAEDPRDDGSAAVLLADATLRAGGDPAVVERWLAVGFERSADDRDAWRVTSALRLARGDAAGAVEAMQRASAP